MVAKMKEIAIVTEIPKKMGLDFREDNLGLLIELHPDFEFKNKHARIIPVNQLLGDLENNTRLACNLVNKLTADEPCFRNVPQLTVYKETLSRELFRTVCLLNMHNYLVNQKLYICKFYSPSLWSDELMALSKVLNSPIQVKLYFKKECRIRRIFRRIISARFSFQVLYVEYNNVLSCFDPFFRRKKWVRKFKNSELKMNKIWFYSTAFNYTNIGLDYEPYFRASFHFLIEDSLTAGRPLRKIGRSFTLLHDFFSSDLIPSKKEVKI